mgnify:CR=1 FL=1
MWSMYATIRFTGLWGRREADCGISAAVCTLSIVRAVKDASIA